MAGGFGKVQTPKKTGKSTKKRVQASQKYDQMKADGAPEFNIFIRMQGKDNWVPAGSLAVERSKQINGAIFQEEENLRRGAARLYPAFRNPKTELEYGYKLKGKEFADEPIQLAVRPKPSPASVIQQAIAQLQAKFKSFLKRS